MQNINGASYVPVFRSSWLTIRGAIRDRRKLTFYFVAEKRIDFRELVRELLRCVDAVLSGAQLIFSHRLYKTRIWMASLQGPGGYEQ